MRHRTHLPTRLLNKLRRFRAGLGLRGECVWPGVRNDLFLAHESVYRFFAGFVEAASGGRQVLDAGCGAGYGSRLLAEAGAASVLGVDVDPRNVRYARRCYGGDGVRFEEADLQELDLAPASFDLAVSSNVLEHLPEPGRFLDALDTGLTAEGTALLVMPPITGEAERAENEAVPFHVTNLTVEGWLDLFRNRGWRVDLYRHTYGEGSGRLDFRSPFSSSARPELFEFPPASLEDFHRLPSLSAVYMLRRNLGRLSSPTRRTARERNRGELRP